MAGYTALAEKLGEEQTYLLMQRVHRELSEAIHANGGTVQEMTGDGIMALFGAPIAIEQAPLRACRAALDLQARISILGAEFEAKHGAAPRFRVGIHSGPLVVGEVGDGQKSGMTALGDTVNLASRIETAAEAGTVFMSADTQALVDGFVDSVCLGERTLKGKSEAQELWRLDAIREGVTRFDISRSHGLTPFVGRERELDQLQSLWRRVSDGSQRTVCIQGEPGIGKSRLSFEFRESIDDDRVFFLECHCAANTQETAFAPLMEIVRRAFRIEDNAVAAEAERRLQQGLEMLGIEPDDSLPYLMNLLGLAATGVDMDKIAGETLGIRTRDAVITMLRERCRVSPTVMVVEDLQWADSATQALLARVVEGEEDLPLFTITTARTGYQPPWSGKDGTTDLVLTRLSAGGTESLLRNRLDSQSPPDGLTRLVAEKSEGNPLFAEEIIAFLQNSGAIGGEGETITFDAGQSSAALPVAIESLLMDRVDRLESGPRAVLETAAVTGARFTSEQLARASGLADQAGQHIETLVQQELIRLEPTSRAYAFRQALTRDAIYDSLLSARRQSLHGRIAASIEGQSGFQRDDAADTLAYHWSRSDDPGRAVKYLAIAGENSLRIYSLEEAQNQLQQALDIIEANPGCVDDTVLADILLHIARALYFQYNFGALIDLVEPYLERIEALNDNRRLSRFLFETGYAHVFGCKAEIGRQFLDRAKSLAEADDDELAVAYADMGIMWHRAYWGQPGEARDRAQREAGARVVEVARRHGDIWLASKGQLANGLDLIAWGRPGESRAAFMELMAMSRETNDPRPRSMGQWALAVVDLYAGNFGEAIERADDALRICLSPVDRLAASAYKSAAMIFSGQAAEGTALISDTMDDMNEKSFAMVQPPIKMAMGAAQVMQGDMANGVRSIQAAQAEAENWGMTPATAMGNQYLGETYLQFVIGEEKPPTSVMLANFSFLLRTLPFAKSKARRYLQNAIDGYRALDAPSFEARCHYNLGLLEMAAKRTTQAQASFQQARDLAETVEATNIVNDADIAMAELGTA